MKTLDEAVADVIAAAAPLGEASVHLIDSLGLVLAEDVASDVDSPPHDKSMVDGYALQAVDLAAGPASLVVLEEVTAGALPSKQVSPGTATRIMTGAPLPNGADAVVMVERTSSAKPTSAGGPEHVRIDESPVKPGQNILRRGTSFSRGNVVLPRGAVVRQIEIGLLAEVGRTNVTVIRRPRVAVLSTGNELVPAEQTPGPGMLRNSNGPLLAAAVGRAGGEAIDLGVAHDVRSELAEKIAIGLRADVFLLSGGVSAGALDLVPGVLAEKGVREIFHKLSLKPGKPVWFGVHDAQRGGDHPAGAGLARTLVFGLPGNPVSTLVTFELLVRPAISVLAGRGPKGLEEATARLASEFAQRGDRTTLHPARLSRQGETLWAEPLAWRGSADLRSLAAADAFLWLPAGDHQYAQGDLVKILRI